MPDIALYYPYTHVRDDAWLKAAALYLPKLALVELHKKLVLRLYLADHRLERPAADR